jgi:fimbrial chaperone protein
MQPALFMIAMAIAVQLFGETSSAAYQLQPISRVFAPSGSKATQSFEVVNDGVERLAVTVSFATLERDEAYVESNRDAEDEFLAYPAQVIVPPGGKQTIRVTWLGATKGTREQTYRIIVTQVPLSVLDSTAKSSTPTGKLEVLMTYRGTLFIRPANAAPKIALHNAELVTSPQGRMLAVTLANTGAAVGLVKSCTLTLAPSAGGAPVTLSLATPATLGNTRVLAGNKRRYVVPWPTELLPGPVTATGQCSVAP